MSTIHNSEAGGRVSEVVRELEELIAALDRRVPHVERVGEVAIAAAAAALRTESMKRIEALRTRGTVDPDHSQVG